MKKSKINLFIVIALIGYSIFSIFIFSIDFFNLFDLRKITDKYDWLAFIASSFAGCATLILGKIAIDQNNAANEINEKAMVISALQVGSKNFEIKSVFNISEVPDDLYTSIVLSKENNGINNLLLEIKLEEVENYDFVSYKASKIIVGIEENKYIFEAVNEQFTLFNKDYVVLISIKCDMELANKILCSEKFSIRLTLDVKRSLQVVISKYFSFVVVKKSDKYMISKIPSQILSYYFNIEKDNV